MTTKKVIISTLVMTVILFFWGGISQMFPWGVHSTQSISTQSGDQTESFQVPNLIELPAHSLTTEKFDEQFANKISTLTTDKTFSWIISKDLNYYNQANYFIREIITQLLVAIFLSLILGLTSRLENKTRLTIIAFTALAGILATYGQHMNWWGMPAIYGVGSSVNIIVGWLLASFVSSKWVLKTN